MKNHRIPHQPVSLSARSQRIISEWGLDGVTLRENRVGHSWKGKGITYR